MGSVQKRPDVDGRPGLWIARWREADGKQRKKSFRRKVDAEAHLRSVEHAQDAGAYVPPAAGRRTVGEHAADWMGRRPALTPKSRSSAESLWRAVVAPRWATVRLDAVRHGDVARWVAETSGRLSSSRTRQSYHLLTALLDDAVKVGLLGRNPAAGVELPRLPKSRRRYLTAEELHALADAAGPYRPLVLVLGLTGLRWGEAAALRVRDLDIPRRRLRVEEAVSDVNGHLIVGESKDHERRTVPVPAFLLVDLELRARGRAPDELLFPSPRGAHLRNQNARRQWWDDAARAAGLNGLTPHELRHTAASLAVQAGANVLAVAQMLGHADPSVTLRVYADLFDGHLDDVADRLDVLAAPRLRPSDSQAPPLGSTTGF